MEKKKKNNFKSKLIYKLVTGITLFVPLPLYLFLTATLFSITPDYIIYTEIDNVEVIEYVREKNVTYFITTTNNASMHGLVEYIDGRYGIVIDSKDIIKIGSNYYSYILHEEKMQLVDIKQFEIQKQQSYKIPISFFISLFGVLLVFLIIQNKMQWYKKRPRLAAFVALLTGTVVLYILNTVISNILGVFLIATASWGLYCLEYLFNKGFIEDKQKDEVKNDILQALEAALGK